ncbi:MAG TPA: 4-coumarate--CoA ligase family protein [Methylomirabilota bacterium]|jgi:acyl-CoA synthetase (AMP-forming)/AMP-acid ligase II|nr:4-coumarate--CoA ligase family protein [Methylomirabilota bacterium]
MIIKSSSPAVTIPDLPITAYVLRHAERLGDKPALIDGPSGRTLTYRQLREAVSRAATGLARRGFRQGDVLAIYSPNLPEYAVVFHAVASLGGINTTVNPLYTGEELAKQLKDSGARFLVTVPPFLDKARDAATRSGIEEIFVIGTAEGARPFADLLQAPPSPPAVAIDPRRDVVVLPYSSGTTGLPKGVMLTHHNLVANLQQCEGMEGFDGFAERDVVMAVLPFFHIYGMVVIMKLALAQGGTLVTMPRFDLVEFLGLIQKYRISILPIVPPIVLGLVKHPAVAQFDLSSVRLVFSGAAPLGEEIARQLSSKLRCPVVQGYGMTEASPVTHLSPTRNAPVKPGSIGKVVPNTEVKIVDVATGAELGTRQEGELLIRGPQIMKGYLNRPQETADSIDGQGWYHTGDVGYVDDEEWFYIVDRTKELIKYKGLQVAPAELEALLLTHPAVLDVAVVRKTDEEAGEVPKAYVVLKADDASRATSAQALMGWTAERVAPHKRIRHVEFIDQIPKSASGKILRRVLIDRERTS